jgi:hypothetical protein
MTDADKQQLLDMLQAATNQRNAAQNECIQLAAQLAAAQRRIAELEKAQEPELPLAAMKNGHAEAGAQA